jgi:hypothetical protein
MSSCHTLMDTRLFTRLLYEENMSRVVFGTEQKSGTSTFLPGMSQKATKILTAVSPEIDCDQTAMGLPPVAHS